MSEIWKVVIGYEGLYEVSNLGSVRSVEKRVPFRGAFTTKRARAMNPRKFGSYLIVTLCRLSKKKTLLVHRLVAEALIDNPENKKTVNHKDCNPFNNHVDNLEWSTQKENIEYAVSLQRHCHGETHGAHKLTEENVRHIRSIKKSGLVLAREFGVAHSTIKRIRNYKTWKHVA